MKNKLFILGAVIASCIFIQATAEEISASKVAYPYQGQQQGYGYQYGNQYGYQSGNQYGYQYQPAPGSAVTNPNMPTGQSVPSAPNGRRPCYPAGKCNGDPNLIGRPYAAPAAPNSKPLQTESTEKFVGTVESINRVSLPDQTQIQMVLVTDRGNVLVILGPASYIDQQKIKFAAGDKVTVNGYRVRANGNEVINAASVQKNGNTLQLLDERRQPIWGGQPQLGAWGYGPQG